MDTDAATASSVRIRAGFASGVLTQVCKLLSHNLLRRYVLAMAPEIAAWRATWLRRALIGARPLWATRPLSEFAVGAATSSHQLKKHVQRAATVLGVRGPCIRDLRFCALATV
jgi:hypothetical protein